MALHLFTMVSMAFQHLHWYLLHPWEKGCLQVMVIQIWLSYTIRPHIFLYLIPTSLLHPKYPMNRIPIVVMIAKCHLSLLSHLKYQSFIRKAHQKRPNWARKNTPSSSKMQASIQWGLCFARTFLNTNPLISDNVCIVKLCIWHRFDAHWTWWIVMFSCSPITSHAYLPIFPGHLQVFDCCISHVSLI